MPHTKKPKQRETSTSLEKPPTHRQVSRQTSLRVTLWVSLWISLWVGMISHAGTSNQKNHKIPQDTSFQKIAHFQGRLQGSGPRGWAEPTAIVLSTLQTPTTTCQVVSEILQKDACTLKTKLLGDWDTWIDQSLTKTLQTYHIQTKEIYTATLTPEELCQILQTQIQRNIPTILELQSETKKSQKSPPYYLLVKGINPKTQTLKIYDTIRGRQTIALESLKTYQTFARKDSPTLKLTKVLVLSPKEPFTSPEKNLQEKTLELTNSSNQSQPLTYKKPIRITIHKIDINKKTAHYQWEFGMEDQSPLTEPTNPQKSEAEIIKSAKKTLEEALTINPKSQTYSTKHWALKGWLQNKVTAPKEK